MEPQRRLKVALILYRDDPKSGGSLRVGQAIAQYLPADQVEATLVFAYGGAGSVSQSVSCAKAFLNAASSADWACWKKTRQWFHEMQFDVLHFVDAVNWVYFATLGIHGKRIDHFHGTPVPELLTTQDLFIALVRRWLNDEAIAITHGSKRGAARIGWMSPRKIHVVQNGVNPDFFKLRPSKLEARQQLSVPQNVILFGAVARFCEGSGVLEFISVLQNLPESWHAMLVGSGPLKPELEEQAKLKGVAHRLHLPGLLHDVRPAYAAFDVVLLLARYQSFCLMLAEAMASDVPIVGLQGAGEYTEPEYPLITAENAVFIPRTDPWDFVSWEPEWKYQQLANAMQDMLNNPESTQQRVTRARDWVTSRFSAKRQAERCLEVYRETCGMNREKTCAS